MPLRELQYDGVLALAENEAAVLPRNGRQRTRRALCGEDENYAFNNIHYLCERIYEARSYFVR